MASTRSPLVVGLLAAGAAGPSMVGHKAATLGRLVGAGFSVPEGLVLTADALSAVLDQDRLDAHVEPGDLEVLGWPATVARAVDEIAAHFGDAPLAVRSSASAEDLPEESFAGQYTTVLRVKGAGELRSAIRSCWVSASTGRVRYYRGGSGPARMAVLVQRLVDADVAGVAFTADPVTGERDTVLVSAVPGTAETLVDGSVTPDQWRVRGADACPVSVLHQALTERQAVAVAELARRLEAELGGPQDVEWAMADQRLVVLQSRPVTALPRPPAVDLPDGTWLKEDERYPEPLTAFGASLVGPLVSTGLTEMSAAWGGLVERFEGRVVGGEPYMRVVPVGGPRSRRGGPPPPWWLLGALSRVVPQLRRRMRTARTMLRPAVLQRALDDWERLLKPRLREEQATLAGVDLAALDDAALGAHLARVVDFLARCLRLHFWLVPPYAVPQYDLCALLARELGWGTATTQRLLAGRSSTTSEPHRELRRVADLVRDDAGAAAIVAEAPADLVDRLEPVAPRAAAALRSWTERYGVRNLHDDPGTPTLLESPALVARLLREAVADPGPGNGPAARLREETAAQARTLLASRPARVRRRFEAALTAAARSYGLREDSAFWTGSVPGGLVRLAMVETGRRLAARGLLHDAGDAAHLDVGTLRGLLVADRAPEADVREAVARNRAERLWTVQHPGPPYHGPAPDALPDLRGLPRAGRRLNQALQWARSSGRSTTGTPEAADDATLLGLAGSPGSHTGTVRLLLGTDDFSRLRRGDVLVCRTTDPAWSVLFGVAGALVTDRGGVLSHAAIVAREHGIPAVLATGNATQILRDGAVVTVDGTTGRVVVHDAVTRGDNDGNTADIAATGTR
jgi:rifampicin phosphotransferase